MTASKRGIEVYTQIWGFVRGFKQDGTSTRGQSKRILMTKEELMCPSHELAFELSKDLCGLPLITNILKRNIFMPEIATNSIHRTLEIPCRISV